MLQALRTSLLDTVFPPRCLACAEPTVAPHGLCPACWRDTHFIAGTVCRACGVPLVGAARVDVLTLARVAFEDSLGL